MAFENIEKSEGGHEGYPQRFDAAKCEYAEINSTFNRSAGGLQRARGVEAWQTDELSELLSCGGEYYDNDDDSMY